MKHQRTRRAGNPNFRATNRDCQEVNLVSAAVANSLLGRRGNRAIWPVPRFSTVSGLKNESRVADDPREIAPAKPQPFNWLAVPVPIWRAHLVRSSATCF